MTKDEEIVALKAKVAELEGKEALKDALDEIAEEKVNITKSVERIMELADEHKIMVSFNTPLNQARGAGGMTYYGRGNPSRDDDSYSYCKPDDYGGWRSSATDIC